MKNKISIFPGSNDVEYIAIFKGCLLSSTHAIVSISVQKELTTGFKNAYLLSPFLVIFF